MTGLIRLDSDHYIPRFEIGGSIKAVDRVFGTVTRARNVETLQAHVEGETIMKIAKTGLGLLVLVMTIGGTIISATAQVVDAPARRKKLSRILP